MRVCEIINNSLVPYMESKFSVGSIEKDLEDWLEKNPNFLLENEKILIIGRQVLTNLGSRIDLLGIDQDGDVVIIELKRDKTPRETLTQALEYASFVKGLSYEDLNIIFMDYMGNVDISLLDQYREYFEITDNETAVVFNRDQKIIIVGEIISKEIRQMASFLREKGVQIFCVEFKFFKIVFVPLESNKDTSRENNMDDKKLPLLERKIIIFETVVGEESFPLKRITSTPKISKERFLEQLERLPRELFSKILDFAEGKGLPIHWGTKGFSINVDLGNGNHVNILYGYPKFSSYNENVIYTTFAKIEKKVKDGNLVVAMYKDKLDALKCFEAVGNEFRCIIEKLENKIDDFLAILLSVAEEIKRKGPIS